MRFLRGFSQQGLVSNWLEQEPPLAKLLKCFDINRAASRFDPVSVYIVRDEHEEMETGAALFQTTPGTPEKRFGILIDEQDCNAAGVEIDPAVRGETGVHTVDVRHADLSGTQEQFARLVVRILARMWQGEQRLRSYPAQQIASQLAVFSRLPPKRIHEAARANCLASLNRVSWCQVSPGGLIVEVRGKLSDKEVHEIAAARSLISGRGISSVFRDGWLGMWKWQQKRTRTRPKG
jgi:hypothetical protein